MATVEYLKSMKAYEDFIVDVNTDYSIYAEEFRHYCIGQTDQFMVGLAQGVRSGMEFMLGLMQVAVPHDKKIIVTVRKELAVEKAGKDKVCYGRYGLGILPKESKLKEGEDELIRDMDERARVSSGRVQGDSAT